MVGNACGNMAEGRAPAVIVTSSWARGKSQDVSEPQFPPPVEHLEGQCDLQWREQAMERSGAEGRILSQQHSRCTLHQKCTLLDASAGGISKDPTVAGE